MITTTGSVIAEPVEGRPGEFLVRDGDGTVHVSGTDTVHLAGGEILTSPTGVKYRRPGAVVVEASGQALVSLCSGATGRVVLRGAARCRDYNDYPTSSDVPNVMIDAHDDSVVELRHLSARIRADGSARVRMRALDVEKHRIKVGNLMNPWHVWADEDSTVEVWGPCVVQAYGKSQTWGFAGSLVWVHDKADAIIGQGGRLMGSSRGLVVHVDSDPFPELAPAVKRTGPEPEDMVFLPSLGWVARPMDLPEAPLAGQVSGGTVQVRQHVSQDGTGATKTVRAHTRNRPRSTV